eukprot:TCONS_00066475-protein
MKLRNVPRINYRTLHLTGVVEPKSPDSTSDQPITMSTHDETSKSLEIDMKVIIEQVHDVIDENPIESSTITDTDITVQKLEELRVQLRRKNHQLGESDL